MRWLLILFLVLLLVGCQRELSEEQAIAKMQEFVDANVRFYVEEGEEVTNAETASIQIVKTEKIEGSYNFILAVESDITGETKKKGLLVAMDAKTGEVVDFKDFPLDELQ